MKKTLFGFAAGAVLTLTLLKIAEVVTYTTNTFRFCLIGDLLVGAAVFVGRTDGRTRATRAGRRTRGGSADFGEARKETSRRDRRG